MTVIELSGVEVTYPGSQPLRQVNAVIGPEPTAITGPSGSGKTTLLRLIAGLQRPDRGALSIERAPVRPASWASAGDCRVATVHQDYRLVEFLCVLDNLRLAVEARHRVFVEADAHTALEAVGLGQLDPGRAPATLSGGEQQRVAIARALITDAQVIVADEPTGALDADTTAAITELLCELGSCGTRLVCVATHDLTVAARMPRRMILDRGTLQLASS